MQHQFLKRPRGYIFKVLWYRIFLLSIFVLVVIFHNKFDYPSHKRCFWHPNWRIGRALNDFSTRYRLYSSKSKKNPIRNLYDQRLQKHFAWSMTIKKVNFWAQELWRLLLKKIFFLPICDQLIAANLSGTECVKSTFSTLGQIFAYRNQYWWP